MATTGHTVKAFDQELDQLRATICEMGGLAEAAIRESMEALVRRDQGAVSGIVERIGDYAKNIAKRVASVEDSKIRPLSLLPEMARIAGEMVRDVLDAFAARDAAKAASVCERDAAVDDFYNSIFRALLTHMMENPHNITPATHLLFVAKNLERIGDHATNVAEMVYFAAKGEHLGDRPKGADVTTIGADDVGG